MKFISTVKRRYDVLIHSLITGMFNLMKAMLYGDLI